MTDINEKNEINDDANNEETKTFETPDAQESDAQKIQTLENEVSHLKDQLLRTLAESENVRKRAQKEVEDSGKYAVASFARELLNVSDNLARALSASPSQENETVAGFVSGVEMTEKELLSTFEKFGVKKIDPLDQKFDHNLHQAMFELENTGKPAGTVVQVLQAGYVLHERLLRPALVGVSKGEGTATQESAANTPKDESASTQHNNQATPEAKTGQRLDTVV